MMNEDTLNQLLDSLSQIKGDDDFSRPFSPPCNKFSASILSAPLLNADEHNLDFSSYESVPTPSSSINVPYSPTMGSYTLLHQSPIANLPILSGSMNEKLDSILAYVATTVRKLVQLVDKQEAELKSLHEKVDRRYKRHTSCITELQEKVYKGGGIHKRKRRDSPVEEDTRYAAMEEKLQQLQQLQSLQIQFGKKQAISLKPSQQSCNSPHYEHSSPYQPHEIKELRIKEAIGQFLKSWNRNYRCGHNYRESCKFEDSKCYRIHENAKHSIIARELRNVLQSGGSLGASIFFQNLLENVEEREYQCSETLTSLQREVATLSHQINR